MLDTYLNYLHKNQAEAPNLGVRDKSKAPTPRLPLSIDLCQIQNKT